VQLSAVIMRAAARQRACVRVGNTIRITLMSACAKP
jgi:hypothetical protein